MCFVAFFAALAIQERYVFSISFLNVGQGDAIFIETPGGFQILVDGGSGAQVIRELQKNMSFFDKSIDMVVATHPDKDHIGGLPDVFQRFVVSTYIESSVFEDNSLYESLHWHVNMEGSKYMVIESPLSISVDGVKIDFLFPDRSLPNVEKNTSSLVMRVAYGAHSFLLMGDAPKNIERYLMNMYGVDLQSNVLKVGHHGSNTSSDVEFISTVSPDFAVISAGCDNRYGHPHKGVIDILDAHSVQVFSTMNGAVIFESDGGELIKK